jgi:hypothetical protein
VHAAAVEHVQGARARGLGVEAGDALVAAARALVDVDGDPLQQAEDGIRTVSRSYGVLMPPLRLTTTGAADGSGALPSTASPAAGRRRRRRGGPAGCHLDAAAPGPAARDLARVALDGAAAVSQ